MSHSGPKHTMWDMKTDTSTITFPTGSTLAHDLPPLSLLLPEQLEALSLKELADYAAGIARRYQSYRAAFDDEGIDTSAQMLELGSHMAMVSKQLADRLS